MDRSMQLLCSTGTFSRYPDFTTYQAILRYGPLLAVDGFELMFYPAWYADIERIADEIGQAELKVVAIHGEKNIGSALGKPQAEEREQGVHWLAENCRLGKLLGARVVVLHLWGLPELDSELENNLEPLQRCCDFAEEYGIALAVETIPCRRADPLSNVHRAVQRDARCRVVLDTEFLAMHGQLEEAFESEWLWQGQRVVQVHIKDFNGHAFLPDGRRRYLHPGEGRINFSHFFANLRRRGFDGPISLESPVIDSKGHVDVERLKASLAQVRGMIERK
jgi:sugar phosphate isomerase/epimerase